MTNQELTNYVGNIFEIEKALYAEHAFYTELMKKKRVLEAWRPESNITSWKDSRAEQINKKVDYTAESVLGYGVLIGLLLGIISGIIIKNNTQDAVIAIFFGVVIAVVSAIISAIILDQIFNIRSNKNRSKAFDEANIEIQKNNKIAQERVSQNLRQLNDEISIIQSNCIRTKDILTNYYNKNIIYEKYRNLVAISTIYEYLKSGRCKNLDGYDGAYNLYENELRQGLIISKLDTIINKLEHIEQNQYLLYSAVQECNRNTKQLMNSVNRAVDSLEIIKDNSEISAYNSQVIAANERFQSMLLTYSFIESHE